MRLYNLIEYSDNYLKKSGSLWLYYRDDPNDNITEFESFKIKIKITGKTPAAANSKNDKIAVPLKYLNNFSRCLETSLINCEINLILTWYEDCVVSYATGEEKFKITDKKLYVPVKSLSTQYNTKLLFQLKSGFKRTINWNRYQPKVSPERQNQYLYFLLDSSFQGVSRLSFIA